MTPSQSKISAAVGLDDAAAATAARRAGAALSPLRAAASGAARAGRPAAAVAERFWRSMTSVLARAVRKSLCPRW
jgi:hypothetical protein